MADVLGKAVQQTVHGGVGALLAADVQHDVAMVHHQCTVAQSQRVVHIVGDHQAGQVVFGHDLFRQFQHLVRRGGVQGGGVLVQQQQFRRDQRGHQQGQCLALAAGQQAHRLLHPVLQAKAQLGEFFRKEVAVLLRDAGEGRRVPRCPQEGQRKIFLNGHMRGRAAQRVLEHPTDGLGALVVWQKGDIFARQRDGAGVGDELARNGVEQRGFARAVGADDGGKVTVVEVKVHAFQRDLLIDGAGVERFADVFQFKHGAHLLSRRWHGGGGKPPWPGWRAQRWPAPR